MESSVTDSVDTTVLDGPGRRTPVLTRSDLDVNVEVPLRDRVRWGAVIAGVVTAFAVLLFLTTVGIALGLSALGGSNFRKFRVYAVGRACRRDPSGNQPSSRRISRTG